MTTDIRYSHHANVAASEFRLGDEVYRQNGRPLANPFTVTGTALRKNGRDRVRMTNGRSRYFALDARFDVRRPMTADEIAARDAEDAAYRVDVIRKAVNGRQAVLDAEVYRFAEAVKDNPARTIRWDAEKVLKAQGLFEVYERIARGFDAQRFEDDPVPLESAEADRRLIRSALWARNSIRDEVFREARRGESRSTSQMTNVTEATVLAAKADWLMSYEQAGLDAAAAFYDVTVDEHDQ